MLGFPKLLDAQGGLSSLIFQLDEKVAAERKQHAHLISLLNIFSNIARDSQVSSLVVLFCFGVLFSFLNLGRLFMVLLGVW